MAQKPLKINVAEHAMATAADRLQQWEVGKPGEYSHSDTPLIRNLVYTFFRNKATLDWILSQLCNPDRTRPAVRRILELGLCEILYFEGLPVPVVVDTCVSMVKQKCGKRETGFVNAVLRAAARTPRGEWQQRVGREAPQAVCLGLSQELYEQWKTRPAAELQRLAALIATPAPLIVRFREEQLAAEAIEQGVVEAIPAPGWMPSAVLAKVSDPDNFFRPGLGLSDGCYIQDPSTLLAPAMLAPKPGERVADMCSAPGGKTLLLADLAAADTVLIAADRSASRMIRLRENCANVPNIYLVAADAGVPPFPPAAFDAILLDVPCSNTGVVRRRPDVQWRFSRTQLADVALAQRRILDGTVPCLKQGGRLAYSTCSIEPEENSSQVARFTRQHPEFRLLEEKLLLPSDLNDGAYCALLQKD